MYFTDRKQAGALLAAQLIEHEHEDNVVLALSAGGVAVGAEIASRLNCSLQLLLTSRITAPGDPTLVLAAINENGSFTYNDMIPASMMEEYLLEFRGYVEEEKLHKLLDLTILGAGGEVDLDLLARHNVIIVSDGVTTGLSFIAALHFLKPARTLKMIGAIPVGPADIIDVLRPRLDELHYLYIPENFFSIDHYYEDKSKPNPEEITAIIDAAVARW